MEPQDGMELTTLFSVEVQDRMGVTGGRADLESKILNKTLGSGLGWKNLGPRFPSGRVRGQRAGGGA